MRVTKGKKIKTVIMIMVFTLIICMTLIGFRLVTETIRAMASGFMQADQAKASLEKVVAQIADEQDKLIDQTDAKLRIIARALADRNFTGWNGEPTAFGDGYIVGEKGDSYSFPENVPFVAASEMNAKDYPELTEEELEKHQVTGHYYNLQDHSWCIPVIATIDNDHFYAEFVPFEQQSHYTNRVVEVLKNVKALEDNYHTWICLIEDSSGLPIYWSSALSDYEENLAAMGIEGKLGEESQGTIAIKNDLYSYIMRPVGGSYTAVILTSLTEGIRNVIPLVLAVCGVILGCYIVFVYWIFSVFTFVRTERLSLHQQKNYVPKRVRSVSFGFMFLSALMIFLVALYGCILIGLYEANENCTTTMQFVRVDDSEGQVDVFKETYDKNMIEELQLTAQLMEQYPELMNKEFLTDVSAIIGSEYLVVYDPEGKEALSDSALRGLSLGGVGDSNGAFLKLRNGVPSVINEPDPSDPNGFTMASYGVPLSFSENQTYGVLAAYISPGIRDTLKIFTHNDMIDLLAPEDGLIFTADPETRDVIYATDPDLIGRNLVDLGMDEKTVKDHFMGFFRLNNVNYYGISQAQDNVLYYVATEQDTIMYAIVPFGLVAAVPYMLLFLILMAFLLLKYKEPNIEWQDAGEEYDDSGEIVMLPTGEEKETVDVSQRWELLQRFRNKKSPGASARLLAEILALICITGGVIYFCVSGKQTLAQQGILGYVLYGEWTKGFNIFAVTAVLLLFCLIFFLNFALEFTGFVLNKFLNTKGETVGRLALNIVRYVLIVVFFYYATDDLGFDTRAVIAGLGLLSFALSLGMKDLVTDLIAGLTIVFEGEFQVGDIVEIGGYRGSVVEVGVRSTKLMGRGGNIKIISNRDVKNVVNMTHMNSWCAVEFTVSREETMDRMEEMLENALPQIKGKISEIISGPYYKGVTAFGHNGLTICVIAECKEKDYHRVQRQLTGELNRVFEENKVKF